MPLTLDDLRGGEGAHREKKRVGRGHGSGKGKTAGRGTKGQKSRSGPGVRRGFEGGQLPIQKRLPYKRGFTNIYRTPWEVVNLGRLEIRGRRRSHHAGGALRAGCHAGPRVSGQNPRRAANSPRPLVIHAHAFSDSAKATVEQLGGSIAELERTDEWVAGEAANAPAPAESRPQEGTRRQSRRPLATRGDRGACRDNRRHSPCSRLLPPHSRSRTCARSILFTLGMLVIFRFFAAIPVPGVNREGLQDFIQSNALLGILNIFSGNSLQNFSIVALGVYPYITASIIMQLMTPIIPSLNELSNEGQGGRNKINQYTHWLTVPLALLQGYGQGVLFSQQSGPDGRPLIEGFGFGTPEHVLPTLATLVTMTAGTMLLVWIGELITEFGIGNGVSIIIFGGIVASLPGSIVVAVPRTFGHQQCDWYRIVPCDRADHDCRHRADQRGPTSHPGTSCQASALGSNVWWQHDVHSAEGQLRGDDPADLRRQHPGLPWIDRAVPFDIEQSDSPQLCWRVVAIHESRTRCSTTSCTSCWLLRSPTSTRW